AQVAGAGSLDDQGARPGITGSQPGPEDPDLVGAGRQGRQHEAATEGDQVARRTGVAADDRVPGLARIRCTAGEDRAALGVLDYPAVTVHDREALAGRGHVGA